MAYDHSTKIGNQGDLAKHIALFSALSHLLDDWPSGREFFYADTHAGRPQYVLPDKCEWSQGIAIFSTNTTVMEDRKKRQQNNTSLGFVGLYDETLIGRRITTGAIYYGSTGIAFRLLRQSSATFRMKLWERNRSVADDLVRYFEPWHSQVVVVCDDGYGVVQETEPISFVLIDPPALETSRIIATLQRLNERRVPFICWTPRTSRYVEPATIDDKGTGVEAVTSLEYIEAAKQVGHCLRVKWHSWGARTPGCCITVSTGLSEIVSPAVRQVSELMEWELEE